MKKIAEISRCADCRHFHTTESGDVCNWWENERGMVEGIADKGFPEWCPLEDATGGPPKCPHCGQDMKEKPLPEGLAQTKHADKLHLWECDCISELKAECARLRAATMEKGTDGPIISMQQLLDSGVNAFGLKLFVESVQMYTDKHGAITFNFNGNIVHVRKEVVAAKEQP